MIKNPPAKTGDTGDIGSMSGLGRFPGGGKSNPLQYFCLEKSHEQRSLADYSPWGCRVGHNLATKPPPPVLYPINISSPSPSRREI